MLWFYFSSICLFSLVNHTYYKTTKFIGTAPPPRSKAYLLYPWFGSVLPNTGILLLLMWGFFEFSWWVPIAVLIGGQLLAGTIYLVVPVGITFVFLGFLVGFTLGIISVVI